MKSAQWQLGLHFKSRPSPYGAVNTLRLCYTNQSLCGQNGELLSFKAGGTYSNHNTNLHMLISNCSLHNSVLLNTKQNFSRGFGKIHNLLHPNNISSSVSPNKVCNIYIRLMYAT